MGILENITEEDIKIFIKNMQGFKNNKNILVNLYYVGESDSLVCFVQSDDAFYKLDLGYLKALINDTEDDYLLLYWSMYLAYLYGDNFKNILVARIKEKYSERPVVIAPMGIPQEIDLNDIIDVVFSLEMSSDLAKLEEFAEFCDTEGPKCWPDAKRRVKGRFRKPNDDVDNL